MSLKTQLLVTFNLLLSLVIAVVLGLSYTTSQLVRYQDLTLMSMHQHAQLQATEISLTRGLQVLNDFVLDASATNAAQVEAEYDRMDDLLKGLLTIVDQEIESLEAENEQDGKEKVGEVYQEALATLAELRAEFHTIIDLKKAGNVAEATRRLASFRHPAFETGLLKAIDTGVEVANQEVIARTEHMARWRAHFKTLGLSAIGLAALCVAGSLAMLLSSLKKIQQGEVEREAFHKDLVRTAHSTGMSEIATGVLHNVGNVLNSVNTSSACIASMVKNSVTVPLRQILTLAAGQSDKLAEFVRTDPRGQMLAEYFGEAAAALEREREDLLEESRRLDEKISHVKGVIRVQQDYARGGVFEEIITAPELIQDAIMLCDRSLHRHGIRLVQRVEPTAPLQLAKSKLLQVLVNLIKNAKEAIIDGADLERVITIEAELDGGELKMSVADTGIGITPENLDRLFNHGFTTKAEGNGFGLHSCAIAIQELGGSISVQSDGPGTGATFTVRVPVKLASPQETEALST